MDAHLNLLSLRESIISLEHVLQLGNRGVRRSVLKTFVLRIDNSKAGDIVAQHACIGFLPQLEALLVNSDDNMLKQTVIGCIDRIAEKYGKMDVPKITSIAKTISGESCLSSKDRKLQVMATISLTTIVEVVKDALIPMIPHALPKVLDLLDQWFEQDEAGPEFHNAAYSFVNSLLLYIPWMLTGDYLDHFMNVSYKSAVKTIDPSCDEIRLSTLDLVAKQTDLHECFKSLTRTWENSMIEGQEVRYEAHGAEGR